MTRSSTARCPSCGHVAALVHVHGHGQCGHCGTNLEPCCSGADALDEAGATDAVAGAPSPTLFPHLFEQLGGPEATVTGDSLRFLLVQHLGTDLDDADLLLAAGEHAGQLERTLAGHYRLAARGSSSRH